MLQTLILNKIYIWRRTTHRCVATRRERVSGSETRRAIPYFRLSITFSNIGKEAKCKDRNGLFWHFYVAKAIKSMVKTFVIFRRSRCLLHCWGWPHLKIHSDAPACSFYSTQIGHTKMWSFTCRYNFSVTCIAYFVLVIPIVIPITKSQNLLLYSLSLPYIRPFQSHKWYFWYFWIFFKYFVFSLYSLPAQWHIS